jgi:hypothetical protein
MLVARAGRICARRDLRVRPAVRNCDSEGGDWEGIAARGDQFTTRIDPIDRDISRSMRAGWGRLHRVWGPVAR